MSSTSKQSVKSTLALIFAGAALTVTSATLPAAALSEKTQKFGWLSEQVKGNQQAANEFCRWWYNKYVNDGTLEGKGHNVRANLSFGRCLVDHWRKDPPEGRPLGSCNPFARPGVYCSR